jgi:sulfofructose kinase
VDVAILSSTFPRHLSGAPAPGTFLDDLVGRLADGGPCVAGLTLGPGGCLVRSADRPAIRIPGHETEVLDTTGAGDVFHGAFLAAWLEGEDLERSARLANAAAALKCRGRTGRAPLPDRAAIRALAGLDSRP